MFSFGPQELQISLLDDLDGGEGARIWEFLIKAQPLSTADAPVPGTLVLMGIGLLGLARARRRS
ncbi:MAG: PEP-CTERM sorting domain-containing protein [Acidobacteria bacterium]|nr:MAG: PEP-CTERM sorting domain-containing protein [Acidobacteriota bacterium]